MALASDLVTDSKLETLKKEKEITVHLIQSAGTNALQRRIRNKQKWKKIKDLGEGSYGFVWLEKLVGGESPVQERAVKQIKKGGATDYSHELHAIAKFSQKQFNMWFVESYGWYEDDQHVFISMEYLAHGDLGGYLDESGPLPEPEVQRIAYQILEGLLCMHDHKFVHRDLKPQNVLIKQCGPHWWVKLGDFGISKRMEDAASLHTFAGTRGFMAPEVLAQHGFLHCEALAGYDSYTNVVDVWALGALVFRALTNSQPFENLASYVDCKTPFPDHLLHAHNVSQEGCDLLERLLTAIPEDRVSASEALNDSWLASQREPPLRASVESQRPISTLFESNQTVLGRFANLARQKSPTIASLAWTDTETSTVVSKAFDTVKGAAKERLSIIARRKSEATQLDSYDNALGRSTIVEQASPSANGSAIFDLPTDNSVQGQPSQSEESRAGSDIGQVWSSPVSARVESAKSLRSSEEECRPTSTTPSYATRSVTLDSALDSPDFWQDSEGYFDRLIAADEFTLSPGTTISEASPSQFTSETSPRVPSDYWTRTMPLSQLSLDCISSVSSGWTKDSSIIHKKGCSLRPLRLPNDLTHTMEPDAFVIIIPGPGDPPVELWNRDGVHDEPLVRDLVKHFMNIQVIVLEHRLKVNGNGFQHWSQVGTLAYTMLQMLHEYREQTNTISIPMVFMGHGIGGIIIKDMFWKSSEAWLSKFPDQWLENLVNSAVGIIFLGTPHLTQENRDFHENMLGLITKPDTSKRSKTLNKQLMGLARRTQYVRSVSGGFREYMLQCFPNLPVVSVWEGRESRAMRIEDTTLLGRRWKVEDYVIVDDDLAKIGLPNEEMMVADCDHYQLCTHNDAEFRQKLIGFCHGKLLEAHGRMLGRSGRSSVALSTVLGEGSNVPSPL